MPGTNPVASLAALLHQAETFRAANWAGASYEKVAEWLLARGVQYVPELERFAEGDTRPVATWYMTASPEAPPREPPMELLQELYDWLYDHADSEGYGRDAGIFAERLKRYLP